MISQDTYYVLSKDHRLKKISLETIETSRKGPINSMKENWKDFTIARKFKSTGPCYNSHTHQLKRNCVKTLFSHILSQQVGEFISFLPSTILGMEDIVNMRNNFCPHGVCILVKLA